MEAAKINLADQEEDWPHANMMRCNCMYVLLYPIHRFIVGSLDSAVSLSLIN